MVRKLSHKAPCLPVSIVVALILAVLSIGSASLPLEVGGNSNSLTITRAELDRDRLRIEGEDAEPNATITVDGVGMVTAEERGRFRVEADGFSSATCQVTVSDGITSVVVSLDRCPAQAPPPAPPPPPAAPPPPPPGGSLSITRAQLDGGQLEIRGEGATANGTIFVDGLAMGAADDRGRFRVEQNGFSPSTCDVSISDGVNSAVVVFDPCGVPPEFTALEVEPSEGPLGVPETLHANPAIDSTAVPGNLPLGSIVSVEIEGVVNGVDGPGHEWQIGSLPHFVYVSTDTRIDKAPQTGDLVRVLAVRTVEPGPLVAERITLREQGPLPVGPAPADIAFVFSGILQSAANDVLRVGGVRFATTALTEIDPAAAEGTTVLVVFVRGRCPLTVG